MSTLVIDPKYDAQMQALIEERRRIGIDRYDEVWEGTYVMAAAPNNEHQYLVMKLAFALEFVLGSADLAHVCPGVNVSDREEDWEDNYRIPDVAVFLRDTKARNCGTFWLGGPDFAIEITSPRDRSHEKLPFYAEVGVREVLIVNRTTWQLELYRRVADELQLAATATVENGVALIPATVPLTYSLAAGLERPQIIVQDSTAKNVWRI
jgi:Uma2 family endonuclease